MFNFFKKIKIDRIKEIKNKILDLESKLFSKRFVKILSNTKRIENKLFKGLLQIIELEGIKLSWVSGIKDMNVSIYGEEISLNSDEWARGVYLYAYDSLTKEFLSNKVDRPAKINIAIDEGQTKEQWVWTLAHELGHHFSVKLNHDRSEEGANKMIRKLSSLCLSEAEMFFIEDLMSIRSDGLIFYYDKENPIEGKVFYNTTAEVNKIYNHKEMLEKLVAKQYKDRKLKKLKTI